MMILFFSQLYGFSFGCKANADQRDLGIQARIPTVKLKIPGKAFLKSKSRTSVTFKL